MNNIEEKIQKLERENNSMKNNIKKSNKKNRTLGITLIALVITIIILLILATITIIELRNTNLFSKTIEAKNKYKQAAEEENNTLDDYANKINEIARGMTTKNNAPKVTKISNTDGSKVIEISGNKVTVTENGTTDTTIIDINKDPSSIEKDSTGNWKDDYDENTKNVLSKVYGTAVEYKSDSDSNKDIDSKTWRIFYIDFANKYGDGAGTIYLKADWKANDTILSRYGSYTPPDEDKIILKNMNQKWYTARGTATWNANEHEASWLCSSTQWAKYKNSDANYSMGSPSIEMYCDSYNSVNHTTGNYKLTCQYQTSAVPGYGYLVNGTAQNSGYSTADGTLDYTNYNSMYCGVNKVKDPGYTWCLASPAANFSYRICGVYVSLATLYDSGGNYPVGVCPLVSLKSNIQLNIK